MRVLSENPRINALFQAGDALHRSRVDLQQEFPSSRSPEFWFWLMWHGSAESAEVRANLSPLPTNSLRRRVVGEADDRTFHEGGLVDWYRMEVCLRDAGYDFTKTGSVLDFGCGCARILRFLALHAGTTTITGADVDSEAIAWCAQNIDFARFEHLSFDPPTQFRSGTFDAVISFSVFSHLSEARQLRWLEELHRITAPGGILVLTIQGEKVIQLILEGQREEVFPPKEVLAPSLDSLRRDGFGFFPYRRLRLTPIGAPNPFKDWDLQSYGAAFILEAYVRRHWGRLFEIIAHRAAPDDWQDYVVLRRKP